MRGKESDMMNASKMARAMTAAHAFCARTGTLSEFIVDAEGDEQILAFRCEPAKCEAAGD